MSENQEESMDKQPCPMCMKKGLTLSEREMDIPFFGKAFLFSMTCSECMYHMADVEVADENQEPSKYTLEISSEEDMKVRIIKSSQATLKIPHITTISPGPASIGYISNVEGVLNRVKRILEGQRDNADDANDRKKAKNLLKKLTKVMWGQEKLKLTLEDPTGNSAIVSEKAVKSKLKK